MLHYYSAKPVDVFCGEAYEIFCVITGSINMKLLLGNIKPVLISNRSEHDPVMFSSENGFRCVKNIK